MCPAPNVTVNLSAGLPQQGVATPTGTAVLAFWAPAAVTGPTTPQIVTSADQVTSLYGSTAPISALAQQVGACLANGAPQVVITRTPSTAASAPAVVTADWSTALAAVTGEFGRVAQVAIPGVSSQAAHDALVAHAGIALSRTVFLDWDAASATPGTGIVPGTVATLTGAKTSYGSATGAERVTVAAPPVIMAGAAGSSWQCPASVLEMGRAAANDAYRGHTNHAPAGDQQGRGAGTINGGISCVDTFVRTDLDTLNDAGVSVIKPVQGAPTLFGWTSVSSDARFHQLSAGRFNGQVRSDVETILRSFLFEDLDATSFVAVEGAIRGQCEEYVKLGALWTGLDGTHAGYDVNVAGVNTPTTIAAKTLAAALAISDTPYVEQAVINVTASVATNID